MDIALFSDPNNLIALHRFWNRIEVYHDLVHAHPSYYRHPLTGDKHSILCSPAITVGVTNR